MMLNCQAHHHYGTRVVLCFYSIASISLCLVSGPLRDTCSNLLEILHMEQSCMERNLTLQYQQYVLSWNSHGPRACLSLPIHTAIKEKKKKPFLGVGQQFPSSPMICSPFVPSFNQLQCCVPCTVVHLQHAANLVLGMNQDFMRTLWNCAR